MITGSHTSEPGRPWNTFDNWEKIVPFNLNGWNDYHTFNREQSKTTPTFFITYEQLILDPVPEVKKLFCFLLDVESVDGTVVEDRIVQICGQGHSKHEVYKLKSGTGRLYR